MPGGTSRSPTTPTPARNAGWPSTERQHPPVKGSKPCALIAAGFVETPLSAALLGDQLDARREQLRTTLPIRRAVGPADIAALAVYLMTNTAVTGATFDIDGGQQLVER